MVANGSYRHRPRSPRGNRSRVATFPQVREGQAQIFGVCPQSETSQYAAEKLSQTLARVNGYAAGGTSDFLRFAALGATTTVLEVATGEDACGHCKGGSISNGAQLGWHPTC